LLAYELGSWSRELLADRLVSATQHFSARLTPVSAGVGDSGSSALCSIIARPLGAIAY
jgi:hypothetical protein